MRPFGSGLRFVPRPVSGMPNESIRRCPGPRADRGQRHRFGAARAGQSGMAENGAVAGPAGLRDRKKARTRALIREQALRLFAGQGFRETAAEQIAGWVG